MTEPSNKQTAARDRIQSMSRNELKDLLVASSRKLGQAQAAIVQKDRLIADFTSQRERAKMDAEKLMEQARTQAKSIKEEAKLLEEQAERRVEEANAEVARKLANANAEADSIVQSRLTQAQADIEKLEAKREEAKRAAIALNKNIAEQYDVLIKDVEGQLSAFKDMKDKLSDFNIDISSEDFKKFDMSDFVTIASTPSPQPAPTREAKKREPVAVVPKPVVDVEEDDMQLNDEDLEILSGVLSDNFDEFEDGHGVIPEDDEVADTLLSDDDMDFLNSDDFDLSSLGFDDDDLSDFDDDDVYADGKMKSFTDSFMKVAPSDSDDDLSDIDIDSILDEDDEVIEEEPQIKIPPRPQRPHSNGAPRWV